MYLDIIWGLNLRRTWRPWIVGLTRRRRIFLLKLRFVDTLFSGKSCLKINQCKLQLSTVISSIKYKRFVFLIINKPKIFEELDKRNKHSSFIFEILVQSATYRTWKGSLCHLSMKKPETDNNLMADEPEIRIRFVPFFLWSATRPRPAWNGRPESWPDPFAAAARCRSAAQPKFRDVVQAEGLPSPGVENKTFLVIKLTCLCYAV